MEFNKSRIYTAVNADELKVGSKVYVADNLDDLQNHVTSDSRELIRKVVKIFPPSNNARIQVADNEGIKCFWHLAYLIEEPESLKWTDLKIGDIIRNKYSRKVRMVVGIDNDYSSMHIVSDMYISDEELAEKWEKV